jgi:glyoxylase-like metal-dependent hydrolase (beta-lactamase superfamily II)
LALAAGALRGIPSFGQETARFESLRGGVGIFTMRGGTIGWFVSPDAALVIDSQFADTAAACLEGMRARTARQLDALINTHHHGDHTAGNIVFRGAAKRVVAQARAAEHMKNPPGGKPPATEQLYPDATFTDTWREQVGDEWIRARYHGPAHTSGDAVVTFERANVAHMGDLMFNQRHPIVDRAAGASIKGWLGVLEKAASDHAADTIFIFGHAGMNVPVTGGRADLMTLRDYFTALLGFVGAQIKSGRSREELLALRDPLKGFERFGPFGNANPRDPLTVAYEELTTK